MGKLVIDASMDAALNYISSNANQVHACATQPTTRTEAVTTNNLASGSITSGDFTLANGDTSGRKQTLGAQSALSITSTGSGDHIAITSATELLAVTTCTAQTLTSGGTVDIAAFDHEIAAAA
jgi:hypothetical protein